MSDSVKPEFMGWLRTEFIPKAGEKNHIYAMPDSGKEIIEAINWMMTQYENVECEYGQNHGVPYCNLVGTTKEVCSHMNTINVWIKAPQHTYTLNCTDCGECKTEEGVWRVL